MHEKHIKTDITSLTHLKAQRWGVQWDKRKNAPLMINENSLLALRLKLQPQDNSPRWQFTESIKLLFVCKAKLPPCQNTYFVNCFIYIWKDTTLILQEAEWRIERKQRERKKQKQKPQPSHVSNLWGGFRNNLIEMDSIWKKAIFSIKQ